MIYPSAPWLPLWMRILVCLLLFNTCSIPFQVCFDAPSTPVIDWLVDAFFWVDIVLNSRLGYYKVRFT